MYGSQSAFILIPLNIPLTITKLYRYERAINYMPPLQQKVPIIRSDEARNRGTG